MLLIEGVSLDGDDPDHILWVCEQAKKRADEFGIQGVTYRLTQGWLVKVFAELSTSVARGNHRLGDAFP